MPYTRIALRLQRLCDLAARTGTGVCQALRHQCIQGLLVQGAALRLNHHFAISHQAMLLQLPQNGGMRLRAAPCGIHIFNTHQPCAAMGAGIEPTGQRRHERACMQRPGGRRRKAAHVWLRLQLRIRRT